MAQSSLGTSAALCRSAENRVHRARQRLEESHRSLARTSARVARFRSWLIHTMVWDGRLPHDRPESLSGRPGEGERCGACAHRISSRRLVMAIPAGNGRPLMHLDSDCFNEWEKMRRLTAAPSRRFSPHAPPR